MNTPAHIVVNLAVLGGGERRRHLRAIAAGALVCDLPIFLFYLWQRFAAGVAERTIWGELYFRADWQRFFDLFNSVPLAAAGGLAALASRRPAAALFFASVVLHAALDLPLHHDDAHRHFLPLSDWRFESPVSYWDPVHWGLLGAALETGVVLLACRVLWRRHAGRRARSAIAAVGALSVAGSLGLAGWVLLGGGRLG